MSVSKFVGDDVFAIDGHGTIHMRLCQSTYQVLGLSGRRSKFGPPGQYFVVEIDMRDHTMRSGKPIYERAKRCLERFPSSAFGELAESRYELNSRRWDVMMTWVDEKGTLDPIQLSHFSPTTRVKSTLPDITKIQKTVPHIPTPEVSSSSTHTFLSLYEAVGEAILPMGENPSQAGVSACTIQAMGLFHPLKLVELAQSLIKTYRTVAITAHTARFSPFSFLISRQANPRPMTLPSHQKRKKKKGKSVTHGPERGTDAGPSSWTLVVLNADEQGFTEGTSSEQVDAVESPTRKANLFPEDADQSREEISRKRAKITIGESFTISGPKRSWVMFESVGHHDTHC